jgi:hypothetical protein
MRISHESQIKNTKTQNEDTSLTDSSRTQTIIWFINILKTSEEIIEFEYIDKTICLFDKVVKTEDYDRLLLKLFILSLLQLSYKISLNKTDYKQIINYLILLVNRSKSFTTSQAEINMAEICNLMRSDFKVETITQVS